MTMTLCKNLLLAVGLFLVLLAPGPAFGDTPTSNSYRCAGYIKGVAVDGDDLVQIYLQTDNNCICVNSPVLDFIDNCTNAAAGRPKCAGFKYNSNLSVATVEGRKPVLAIALAAQQSGNPVSIFYNAPNTSGGMCLFRSLSVISPTR